MSDLGIGILRLFPPQVNCLLAVTVEPGNGRALLSINMKDGPPQESILVILVTSPMVLSLWTGDFFDTKHKVVLGGSWATLPRVAGRRTFTNWYQAGYGYAWAGARVVKDLLN